MPKCKISNPPLPLYFRNRSRSFEELTFIYLEETSKNMGYDLHIIRQHDYDNSEENSNITLDEWYQYITTDKEMELLKESLHGKGTCVWPGPSGYSEDTIPYFEFWKGEICVKNPDDDTIGKMIRIAQELKGKLRGDEGEYYDESYFTNGGLPIDFDPVRQGSQNIASKKPWWKFW